MEDRLSKETFIWKPQPERRKIQVDLVVWNIRRHERERKIISHNLWQDRRVEIENEKNAVMMMRLINNIS